MHYMRATKIRFALLVNFGRAQFQYDTFDLGSLTPTSAVADGLPPAAEPQTETSLPQTVEGGCLARSPDHSAER